MAVTATFSITGQTLNGEQMIFTDGTTYGDPLRADVVVIIRAVHVDSDLNETRKEFVAYDPTTASSFVLNVDQTDDDISPVDGVHKISMFILDEASHYGGVNGSGQYLIDGAAESTYTDTQLDVLSESSYTIYVLPLPQTIQAKNDVVRLLSDGLIDSGTENYKQILLEYIVKIVGSRSQLQKGSISRSATIVESE